MTLEGIIVGINGYNDRNFNLNSRNERKVTCYFVPDMEGKIISLHEKWDLQTCNFA